MSRSAVRHTCIHPLNNFLTPSTTGIHNDRVNFLVQLYELDKREIIENYEREMDLYKGKKFGLQKDLECVFYGLAEKARTDRLRNEEEHMLKKDELKNSVSIKRSGISICFGIHLHASNGESTNGIVCS